jgi:hypothetical protein
LGNHLSSFELRQNSTTHLNQCLLLNIEKIQQCCIWELNPSFFLFSLHKGMVINEHQYVTKMALNVSIRGLWGDFTTIFWIVNIFKGQFTFGIKYQNTLCLDVAWIFTLSFYVYHTILNILNQFNMLMVYLGLCLFFKFMIPK